MKAKHHLALFVLLLISSCTKTEVREYSAPKEQLDRNAIYLSFIGSDSLAQSISTLTYSEIKLTEKQKSFPLASVQSNLNYTFTPIPIFQANQKIDYLVLPLYMQMAHSELILFNKSGKNDTLTCVNYNPHVIMVQDENKIRWDSDQPVFIKNTFKKYKTSFDSEHKITYITVYK